jgi:phosphate transport system protein
MVATTADLERCLLDLGKSVELAISRTIIALLRHDVLLAQAVIKEDNEIDRAEVEVQEMCLRLLEHDRPSGDELRFIVAVLKINDSLERIGDLAENVADVVVEVGHWERFKQVEGIQELAETAQTMVRRSLDALVERDVDLARDVIRSDDHLDALQDRIKQRIEYELDRIPENSNPLMKLEHVSRQFERIGDVATNIAEEVVFMVEGHIVRHCK